MPKYRCDYVMDIRKIALYTQGGKIVMLLTLLCWFAIIFFFAATVRKFMDYAKKPMHGRQDLYPIPGEPEEKAEHGGSYFEDQKWWEQPRKKNHVGEIVDMLKEMLFIKKLFVKQRKFWWISYALHLASMSPSPCWLLQQQASSCHSPVSSPGWCLLQSPCSVWHLACSFAPVR